jgi:hypothetical protein
MAPDIQRALDELRAQFPKVAFIEQPDGGVRVTVPDVPLGPPYAQSDTWFGFTITHLHPYSDIYPLFVRADLSRLDGAVLGPSINAQNSFYGEPAVMLSRRTRFFGPGAPVDPLLKLLKVQKWLLSQ